MALLVVPNNNGAIADDLTVHEDQVRRDLQLLAMIDHARVLAHTADR